MSKRIPILVLGLFLAAIAGPSLAPAQCLEWHTFPRTLPELAGNVSALIEFDDGTGTALYVGGFVTFPSSSSPTAGYGVVRWDGHGFTPVGTLPAGTVTVFSVFDDGSGAALYALASSGGSANPSTVVKWNGSSWQSVGVLNGRCTAMTVHDDGTGPALCVAGDFYQVSSVAVPGVARWNGTTWSPIGNGPFGQYSREAHSLVSVQESTGPALYVGGYFLGLPINLSSNIAKWQGGTWSGVGNGVSAQIPSMAAFDDGTGPALYVAAPDYTPGQSILRWDGLHWSGVAASGLISPGVLTVLDDGSGPQLWVGTDAWLPPYHAVTYHYDGTTWGQVAPNSTPTGCTEGQSMTQALAFFDEGNGRRLFAGTTSGGIGLPLSVLARNDGTAWNRLGPPLQGIGSGLLSSVVHDDGSGPALYIGGSGLCLADETSVWGVARWTGTAWAQVGNQFTYARALASCDFGQGPLLMAGAGGGLWSFGGVAWSNVGNAVLFGSPAILALKQFGGHVYVGGSFTSIGGVNSTNLARWNPSSGFSTAGTAPNAGVNGDVNALETFDDGHGLALYAAGSFTIGGSTGASHIVRFDGTNWAQLGSGTNALVDALITFDDGTGNALYAAGTFTSAGGVPASCVAKWNGTTWTSLGAGLNAQVLSLEVFDDGSGPALYAGGNFSASGNAPMEHIAKWNGTTWSAVGGNVDGTVWTLRSFDDGTGVGPQLFAGGTFRHAGTLPSENFAAWRGCGGTISKFCFGDGSAGACPCGNFGLSGRGCDNSVATGGARLNATGTTSPDTIVLHAGGELPNAPTLVFQGSVSLSQPTLFGDGLRCVGGNLKRLFTTSAIGGAINVPDATQVSISARSAMLGDPLVPGSVRSYQAWYRDPNLSFCAPPSGDAWNLSNAVRIVW